MHADAVSVLPPFAPAAVRAAPAPAVRLADRAVPSGIHRLDVLLGGGFAPATATLLYGPPFCGKQQLQHQAIMQAARDGTDATVVLHTLGAAAMSARLRALEPRVAAAEAAGTLRYVDVHSHGLGEPTDHPAATYVQDALSVAEVLKASEPRRDPQRPAGLLAIESASAMLVDLGPVKAFTVLRTMLARHLNRGGAALLCLEGGMHAESEVQMAKHLCAGMIEMRKKGEAYCLHVEGLETAFLRPGWIEYQFSARSFKVTGSFASRSIPAG